MSSLNKNWKRKVRLMKIIKRLGAILLSLLFVFWIAPVNAQDAKNYIPSTDQPSVSDSSIKQGTLTITKKGSTSTFVLYKLFSMSCANGSDTYTYSSDDTNFKGYFSQPSAPKVSDIKNYTAAQMTSFTKDLHNYIAGADKVIGTADDVVQPDSTLKLSASGTVTEDTLCSGTATLDLGYYLVIETSTTGARIASDDFVVSVPSVVIDSSGNKAWNYHVTAACKDSTVTFNKKIVEGEKRVSSTTKNIGDIVDYEILADVPKYDASVPDDTVKYELSDTMCDGLTFDRDSLVILGINDDDSTTTLTSGYTVESPTASTTFTINFTYAQIKNYKAIKVLYSARLNEKAAIGQQGNDNTGELIYTNNPNKSEHHETRKTYVYTFGINLLKVDSESQNTRLDGATFELLGADGTTPLAVYTYDSSDPTKSVIPLDSANPSVTTQKGGSAYFLGVKDGTYYIHEISAPSGYQLLSGDIAVTIKALTGADGQPNGDFTCTYTLPDGTSKTANYTQTSSGPILKILATFMVPNTKGFTLPGTGGMGTKIFTLSGIGIVVLGGVMGLLYFRKKEKIGM
jgi:fimbrial isopeptide formation D2 family protein/LPXTG-motif cell wall-anchored protein